MGEQSSRKPVVASCLAVACWTLTAVAIAGLLRYTPVYKPLECVPTAVLLGPLTEDLDKEGMSIAGETALICDNANLYTVNVKSAKPGRITTYPDKALIGYAHVFPLAIPSGASGKIQANISLEFGVQEGLSLAMRGIIDTVLDVHLDILVEQRIFTYRTGFSTAKSLTCGVKLHVTKAGPVACADHIDDLVIPEFHGRPVPYRADISQEQIQIAEHKRDSILAPTITVFGALALVCSFFAIHAMRHQLYEMLTRVLGIPGGEKSSIDLEAEKHLCEPRLPQQRDIIMVDVIQHPWLRESSFSETASYSASSRS